MLLISAEDAGHAEQAAEEAAALAITEGVASNTQEAAPTTEEAAEAAALFGNCSATALKEQLSGTSTLEEQVALFDKWLEPARKKRLPVVLHGSLMQQLYRSLMQQLHFQPIVLEEAEEESKLGCVFSKADTSDITRW